MSSSSAQLSELFKIRLVDRDYIVFRLTDLYCIDIHAQHVVANFCKTGACDKTNVACAKYGNFYKMLMLLR